jgi:DNA-binding CsgD family transcriptional regulator
MTARNGAGTVVVPLQELLEAMTDGVLITDENGRCTYSNPALDQLVGGRACEPASSTDAPLWIGEANRHEYRRLITRALNDRIGRRPMTLEWTLIDAADEPLTAQTKIIPMHNGSGPSSALLWVFCPAGDQVRNVHDPRRRELEDAMRRISEELSRVGVAASAGGGATEPVPQHPDLDLLSRRERDVVVQLLHGHRVVSIAELLEVSEHTVRNHLKSIFRKLEVHSQAELVDRLHSTSVAS